MSPQPIRALTPVTFLPLNSRRERHDGGAQGAMLGVPALPPPQTGSEGCAGGLTAGRRGGGLAGPGTAVTQRREPWPHALQLSARSRWVPSTCSPRRPRSRHPQAAQTLLGGPRATSHRHRASRASMATATQDAPPAPRGLPHGRCPGSWRWGPQRHSSQAPRPQPSSSGGAERVQLGQHPCPLQKAG